MSLLTPSSEMLARLDKLRGDLRGHRVGVYGLGIAGRAMALYLVRRGARVVGVDSNAGLASAAELRGAGVELRLGPPAASVFADVEGLFVSPGVDPRRDPVTACIARGIPVAGELELAFRLPAHVVGITGTNGKSTTTALLGALVRGVGHTAFVGGNFGEPIVSWLDRHEPADVAVIELSSFQLETAYRFGADVAVVLNLTPDHLGRYESVAEYGRAKQRLVENLSPQGVAILSYDDLAVRAMASATAGRVWWFSTRRHDLPGDGAYLDGERLVPTGSLRDHLAAVDLTHPGLLGRHNRENAIAAFLAAHALGFGDAEGLSRAYRAFGGLEHRLELVGEVNGVRFINDSKATNDDAAAIAVAALAGPIVLLLGGRSKGGGYAGLLAAVPGKLRAVIAFGEARDEIAQAFAGRGRLVVVDGIERAFREAVTQARPGDVVLLSPACASFDEFTDYAERGRTFKRWVHELAPGATP